MNSQKLTIALQKSGRLSEESGALLKKCGISFSNGLGKLKSEAVNFPLEIFFLRDDDIPQYVADGVADIGIVGENIIYENGFAVDVVEKLNFGKCRLSLAAPKHFRFESLSDFAGKRIATSYPNILRRFFDERNIETEIHSISGSVEIAPSIGLADAVCDLVSSGSTLFTNGLVEIETVLKSEAVLIAQPNLEISKRQILDKLLFRVRSVNAARQNKYILLNAPNHKLKEIISILPGIKSPTIMPLAEKDWSSIHSVINENDFWEVVESLKNAGAEGVLVLAIDQLVR